MGNGHLEILMMRGLSKWQPYIIKGSRSGFQKQLPYAAVLRTFEMFMKTPLAPSPLGEWKAFQDDLDFCKRRLAISQKSF